MMSMNERSASLFRGGRIWRAGKRVMSCAPLVGIAIVASAGEAGAQACGAPSGPGASLTCTGASYPSGISYTGVDGLTLTLDNPAMVVVSGGGPGVRLQGTTGLPVTLDGKSFQSVTTSGSVNGSWGLASQATGLGASSVILRNGVVTTTAGASSGHGIVSFITNAANASMTSALMEGGSITTQGTNAVGVYSQSSGLGQVSAAMTSGTVTTTAGSANGMWAQISNASNASAANATLSGGSISTTGSASHGVFAQTNGTGAANATVTGGSITTASTTGYGVYANASGANSSAAANATMSGGTISTTGGGTAYGIAAITNGTGNVTATLTSGTIDTTSSAGIFAQASGLSTNSAVRVDMQGGTITSSNRGIILNHLSAGGTANVSISGGTITTSGAAGANGAALLVSGATSATATVGGAAAITTNGTGSSGLVITNQGTGASTITINGGTIQALSTSAGANSNAVWSNSSVAASTGANTINMLAGTVDTRGGGSRGLVANTTGLGATSITVSGGTITTSGTNAHATSSNIANTSSSADSQVVLQNGTITASGTGSRGLWASTNGSGAASVGYLNGSVTSNGIGAYAENTGNALTGAATVSMQAGTLATSGSDAYGLYARNDARGATSVTLNGGSVTTTGTGASGLFARSFSAANTSAATVSIQGGTISASGTSAIGARAESIGPSGAVGSMTSGSITSAGSGLVAFTSGGSAGLAAASLSGGTITTTGASAMGLYSWTNGSTNAGTSTATMTGGGIVTSGTSAVGVRAESRGTGAASAVISGGTVQTLNTTASTAAHGVMSVVTNTTSTASSSVVMQGSTAIETRGGESYGIFASTSGRGSATATLNSGTISMSGASSYGAFANISNAASTAKASTTMNGGTITGNGSGQWGIGAQTTAAGNAEATMVDGLISLSGSSGRGVVAFNNGLGASTALMSGGSIALGTDGASQSSIGVWSWIAGADNTATASATLENGTIDILGNNSLGMRAITSGKGDAVAQILGGAITTQGNGRPAAQAWISTASGSAAGSNASTAAARMDMQGGRIQTAGTDAIGLEARTEALGGAAITTFYGGSITTAGLGAYGAHAVVDNALSTASASASMSGSELITSGDFASGLVAQTNGLGDVSTALGTALGGASITTAGASAHGLYSFISNTASSGITHAELNGGTISTTGDGASGLRSENLGSGNYDVFLSEGTVTTAGDQAYGIHTLGTGTGTINIGPSAVLTSLGGVAIRDGDAGTDTRGGSVTVSSFGTVNGGAQLGLGSDTFNLLGGSLAGDIYGDDVAAVELDGNDTFNWSGGTFTGSFFGGGGSDVAYVTAVAYNSTQGFHGGVDPGADTLTFDGVRSAALNGDVTGWEQTTITNGSVIGLKGTAANDLGSMDIASGSALIAYEGLVLRGNLSAAGVIDLSGTTVPGDTGAGAIAAAVAGTGPGVPGTELVAGGNFTGGGDAILDVNLAEAQLMSSDRLMIGGNVAGQTTLYMNNTTPGLGAKTTGDGILLVEVGGTAAKDAFALASGPITSGAFVYDLDFGGQNDDNNNFYLVSSLTPEAATYQAVPYLMSSTFVELPGLVKRRAGRVPVGQGAASVADGPLESLTGGWAQIEGGRNKTDTNDDSSFSTDHWSVKLGYDADAGIPLPGRLIVGGYATYANAGDTVDSNYGSGSISSDAIGAGVAATYYSDAGSYLDLQGRVMGIRSDLDEFSDLISTAAAGSAEVGHVFGVGSSVSLVPSAQLQYAGSSASAFVDDLGNDVSGMSYDGFTSRVGMAMQAALGESQESGPLITASLDWIHDFSPDLEVRVDGADIEASVPGNWLEAGLGVDWRVGDNSLLELRANYAIAPAEDIAYNYNLGASANFRVGF